MAISTRRRNPSHTGPAALVLAAVLGSGPALAGTLSVVWREQMLSVTADDVPRADVLREVARRTGARIRGIEQVSDRVTLRLTAVDLAAGLRTLAGSGSYALAEAPARRTGASAKLELVIAAQDGGYRQPDVMRDHPPVVVLVEDPRTGRMLSQTPPPTPAGTQPNPARPDAAPVSVRIDTE